VGAADKTGTGPLVAPLRWAMLYPAIKVALFFSASVAVAAWAPSLEKQFTNLEHSIAGLSSELQPSSVARVKKATDTDNCMEVLSTGQTPIDCPVTIDPEDGFGCYDVSYEIIANMNIPGCEHYEIVAEPEPSPDATDTPSQATASPEAKVLESDAGAARQITVATVSVHVGPIARPTDDEGFSNLQKQAAKAALAAYAEESGITPDNPGPGKTRLRELRVSLTHVPQ